MHVERNSKCLEEYVDQFILNVPTHKDPYFGVRKIGRERYSATIDMHTNHLANSPGIQLLNDQEIFFDAYANLCPRNPDIVHCHDAYFFPLAKKIRALFGSKIVVTSHLLMTDVLSMFPGGIPTKSKYQIETELQAFNQADAVITISEYYRSFLIEKLMVDPSMIHLVYNGVDKPNVYRERVEPRPKVIGFLGRCAEMKGIRYLKELIEQMPEQRFRVITAVKGDCMDPFALESFAWLKQQTNVELVNGLHPDDKWPHMMDCDVAIMPSVREPWGIVAVEWMGMGVPLIASNTGGLSEIATPERAWQCDPTRLLEAVQSYRYDGEKVLRAKRFADSLSWEQCALKTWEVYKWLLQPSA